MIKFIRNWGRKKEGTTAIEFALLFMPYLLLSLGTIELSLMFASESLLEGSVTKSSRMVKTGQLQQSGSEDPEADFRKALCSHAIVLIKCDGIVIEARTMDSFSDYSSMQPSFGEDGAMVPQGFSVGGSSERVLIRVSYNYKAFTPLVGHMLWGPDASRMFMSTIVLQTEPYDFAAEMDLMENGGM